MQASSVTDSEPSPIARARRSFFNNLMNLWRYAAVHGTEAHIYGAMNHLFATFCSSCKHSDEDVFIFLHPQNEFRGDSLNGILSRRYPDFAVLGTVNQIQQPPHPGYRKPFLVFWVEVKPLHFDAPSWTSREGQALSGGLVRHHIAQVSEQAYLGLQQHGKRKCYALLTIGWYFTLLLYTKESDNPGSLLTKSVESIPLLSSSQTSRLAKKRGVPSPDPSPSVRRRQKIQKLNDPSPNDKSPFPPPPSGGPLPVPSLEAASCIPKIVYFHERILNLEGDCFEPRFLKALQLAMNDVDMTYEDSTFICPPGDHPPTEGSIAVAQEALVAAFASAPEESLLPDSPDHPSSIYQPSPQPSPLAQPSFETPRRAPLTRRKAKTVSSSISSAVETLMASGMDRLTAIEYASDDQEAHARRQSDESFFDAHDGPVAGPSRGTQSYRNSFHEALASSSSSSGSPYLFDHRVFGSEEWTDASSEAEPVPSSQYSSEADALDEHSVSADASGEEEESARYVSRKGKERAL